MYEVISLVRPQTLSMYEDVSKDYTITARIDSDGFNYVFAVSEAQGVSFFMHLQIYVTTSV
jgi:hypothetical protein